MPDNIPHLTIRLTDERKLKLEALRKALHNHPGGKRVRGSLNDAQIIDWALDCLQEKTSPLNR